MKARAGSCPTVHVIVTLVTILLTGTAVAETNPVSKLTAEVGSDFRYVANNVEADLEDVVTSPLHAGTLLRNPNFYYGLLGVSALLGGAFALDETVRPGAANIPDGTAKALQQSGQWFAWGGTAALYGWGLYADDVPAREDAITGLLSSGLSSLETLGIKSAFGRVRPRDSHDAFRFFDHGDSFVSGAATPIFSLAATLSEYGENRWYFAAPAYAAAAAVGIGRMGQNAHWLSDVVGSAVVGVGTTELLLHLHREHAENPSRFRIFPVVSGKTFEVSLALEW